MIPEDRPTLLKHLIADLSSEPSPYNLHLIALTSQPKRTTSIFPYTPNPPRCFQQEYLVTLSADVEPINQASSSTAPLSEKKLDQLPSTSTSTKRILLSAVSAYLYTFPTTSSSILYISKIDSSGYTPSTSYRTRSPTRQLVQSFITYFLQPSTRPTEKVWCQLFARSQNQYLFANSVQGGGKKVLGGLGLCGWWKGVFEGVASRLVADSAPQVVLESGQASEKEESMSGKSSMTTMETMAGTVHLAYLLPSYSAEEAAGMLGPPRKPLPQLLKWVYQPPFHTPIASTSTNPISLASLIPSLPDDPKTRFLEQLVDEGIMDMEETKIVGKHPTPTEKALPSSSSASTAKGRSSRKKEELASDEIERKLAYSILTRTKPSDFWEQMGFRQECSSGDVTGFFTLGVGSSTSPSSNGQPGNTSFNATEKETIGPVSKPSDLPTAILDRLLTALLNTDFRSRPLAIEGTGIWESSVTSIASGEVGLEVYQQDCVGVVKGKEGLTLGDIGNKREREEVKVTMLQPRKKKK